ncbi:MAG: ADP-ribosyltransferase exoenzyme domain protein, partial [Faunusvirus sp.]
DDYIKKLKRHISKIDLKIPLYDIYNNDIYMTRREDVFYSVTEKHMRLPDKKLYDELKQSFHKIESTKNYRQNKSLTFLYNKLKRNIDFLSNYSLSRLERTYVDIIYYHSNEVGKNITICSKPSFLPYLTTSHPYYSRSELINLALNMKLIESDQTYYDNKRVGELCGTIKRNDINAATLLNHQWYVEKNNGKYLVQYYTFYGSYFMNKYLRNSSYKGFKNSVLEDIIEYFWRLIVDSPAFDTDYIVYRFVADDAYLSHLKPGDIFMDKGFMSATRNPFYDASDNKFGFILLKIKISANMKGVGLCVETYSLFPGEEEIVLPPNCKLRLENKDDNFKYYHTNPEYARKIKKKYEFTVVESGYDKKFKNIETYVAPQDQEPIDFLNIAIEGTTIREKIEYFNNNYVNQVDQCRIKYKNKVYTANCHWYNSSNVYYDFFYIKTDEGYYMTLQDTTGKVKLLIEINDVISVNYYFKFTDVADTTINDDDILYISSMIAVAFKVDTIILHPNYESCKQFDKIAEYKHENKPVEQQIFDQSKDIITYCKDLYDYIKYKKKRFNGTKIVHNYPYFQIDKFKSIKVAEIVHPDDKDDIHKLYIEFYKPYIEKNGVAENLQTFYLYVIENFYYKIDLLELKIGSLFANMQFNPFLHKYYTIKPFEYMFDIGAISYIPKLETHTTEKKLLFADSIEDMHNNQYRKFRYVRSRI